VLSPVYAKFVPTGKLEIVFLDFPLPMHPHAFKAAEAAACAGDQKMFWEMHHQLFGNQRALAPDRLPGYAAEVGLDVAAFQKCLDSGRHAAGIREDIRTVQHLGITGTPAYLLGRRLPDSDKIEILDVIKGLPPYEAMEAKINALLPQEPPEGPKK
jgi:protein-disulfide isomerase